MGVHRFLSAGVVLALAVVGCGDATEVLPDSVPTPTEIADSGWFDGGFPRERIESRINLSSDELPAEDVLAELVDSVTITNYDGITVWDYSNGVREISAGSGFLVLAEDGSWQPGFDEAPLVGPLTSRSDVGLIAQYCLGQSPEVIGGERIVDVLTMHVQCTDADDTLDVWVDENGIVLRLQMTDTSLDGDISWDWGVVALDEKPGGELPPGVELSD